MGVRIDVHSHLLQADAVEMESFVKAWFGLNELPNPLVRRIIRFVVSGGGAALGDILALLEPILGSGTAAFGRQLKMTAVQFWPNFTAPAGEIVRRSLEAHPPSEADLLVPLMTDYEEWLGDDPPWFAWRRSEQHPDQSRVEWKSQVIRDNGGRVHLFAPFCPLRAAGDGIDSEVGKVLDLVEREGFIGVKLYPIMGYYPCGNDHKSKPSWLPKKRRKAGVRWAHVDDALDHLYAACAEREIPITAHCSPQGARGPHGASPGDKSQANQSHPCNWVPVLRKYPSLRLNLAHMAGDHFQTLDAEEKGTITDWAFQIAQLMGDPDCPHLYADRACQLPPSDPEARQAYAARLFEVLAINGQVPRRMMNGSDWHLALMYGDYAGEWAHANARFWHILALRPEFAERFFGENAADFLGLRPGGRNRERLRSFYTDKLLLTADRFPAWWAKTA